MLRPSQLAIVAFACTVSFGLLPVETRGAEPEAKLRVFYTGHSFHMFVPKMMEQLSEAAGVEEYQSAGAQGLGGSRVEQHWNLPEERNKAKAILTEAGTDVFTMAPNVRMPDAGIDNFAQLALKHNPQIRLMIQESWVPGDFLETRVKNNDQRDQTDMDALRASQLKWREQIEAQAAAINKQAGKDVAFVMPVGDAVVKLRELVEAGKVPGVTKQSELFRDTIGHGNAPILALTAYCNFACITGKSPVGLTAKPGGISDEMNTLLQQIAWDTVSSYPLSGVKASK